jgi:hypothetical protein
MLRIRDFYPESEFFHPGSRVKEIPDPHQRILSIFNPKNCFQALGNMLRDVHPGSGSGFFTHPGLRIPDSRVKKAQDPDPQHRCTVGRKTCV